MAGLHSSQHLESETSPRWEPPLADTCSDPGANGERYNTFRHPEHSG